MNWLNFLDDLNFGGCLADDMGLGKSIQIIAFILSQRNKVQRNTNLLVVPSTLIFNWQQEVARFAPSIKLLTVHGASRIRDAASFDQYELILTSYGTLLTDIQFMKDYVFNYVFLDESQNIKNPETQRYKSVRLLNSRNKIAVTGTPIENNTFDLFSQLSFACPGLLGSKQFFKDTYSIPIDTFKSSKRAIELHKKVKPFILRRTKQEVAPELPEKTEMVLYCEMEEEQRGIYEAYEKEFREYISATTADELKKSPMNVLKGLTRLRQICDAPALLGDDALTGTSSAKINTLIEQIETKSPHHKIIVFSQFVSMLQLIRTQLISRNIGFEMLTGSTRNRGAVVNAFQTNPNSRVFLISLKAGGTGLNLTEADYVYLVDPWWNPAVENQAIDRAHRIGQDKK
ncbi:DEAD/DEAH box helicase [Paraflavitalea speifideaquila]|uniref:DEAD/DEAH box helicase n=1 Tax=Paraflavitalea speifideaquila TaxID=3076558 RepID=UPI0028E476A7|nr:DEAD/DEAH box helicase [Paraflavitalea speifideiaquila]